MVARGDRCAEDRHCSARRSLRAALGSGIGGRCHRSLPVLTSQASNAWLLWRRSVVPHSAIGEAGEATAAKWWVGRARIRACSFGPERDRAACPGILVGRTYDRSEAVSGPHQDSCLLARSRTGPSGVPGILVGPTYDRTK